MCCPKFRSLATARSHSDFRFDRCFHLCLLIYFSSLAQNVNKCATPTVYFEQVVSTCLASYNRYLFVELTCRLSCRDGTVGDVKNSLT